VNFYCYQFNIFCYCRHIGQFFELLNQFNMQSSWNMCRHCNSIVNVYFGYYYKQIGHYPYFLLLYDLKFFYIYYLLNPFRRVGFLSLKLSLFYISYWNYEVSLLLKLLSMAILTWLIMAFWSYWILGPKIVYIVILNFNKCTLKNCQLR
jgi:hypothetical protein